MSVTGLDIVTDALSELEVVSAGETLKAEDADLGLRFLNRLLDSWNADRQAVYADTFLTYALTANLSPHTIGPTGTFAVPQRPVTIEGVAVGIGTGVLMPIPVRDAAWWETQRVPGLGTSLPTSVFYNPTWPNGELWFWPVPSTVIPVRIQTRVLLAALTLASTFSLPPGYQEAISLTLAETCAAAFGTQAKASTIFLAQKARARIFDNNTSAPRLTTRDAGIPGGRGGIYNYLLGTNS